MTKIVSFVLFMALALVLSRNICAQVLIIAHPGVKATEIHKSDLRGIFTGFATSLPDGARGVPVLLKGGAVHEEFLQAFIGKNDFVFRAGWRSLVFSGQASMPRSMDSETVVVEYVARTP